MEYTKPVTFIISPENPDVDIESELIWDPEEGLKAKEDSFSSEVSLFAIQQNAISREIEFGEEYSITPEGPSVPTNPDLKDIHAAVFFIFDTFSPERITVEGEAPTLQDMGLVNNELDEYGRQIIN